MQYAPTLTDKKREPLGWCYSLNILFISTACAMQHLPTPFTPNHIDVSLLKHKQI